MGNCHGDRLPERWWTIPETLRDEYEAHGTLANAAAAHGGHKSTLALWWKKHGFPPLKTGARPAPVTVRNQAEDQWLLDAIKQLGDQSTVSELADHSDRSPRRVREAIERLGLEGFRVSSDGHTVALQRHPTVTGKTHVASPELFDGDLFRFAVISDTHLGSKAENPDAIETAYEIIVREGIRTVYHVGDLVDGYGIYKLQNAEVSLHTFEDQRDHAVAVYPRREGVTTFIISGNHDLEGDFGRAGADPVAAVCNVRDDMEHLGRYSAWVELPNGATMHLLHPMGGAAYAASYRPQKIVEGYDLGEKPSVLLIGHWHRYLHMPIRGVQVMLAGTFQGPTTYSVRKAFGAPAFGFTIVECSIAQDASVVRFKPEWFPFYPGRSL